MYLRSSQSTSWLLSFKQNRIHNADFSFEQDNETNKGIFFKRLLKLIFGLRNTCGFFGYVFLQKEKNRKRCNILMKDLEMINNYQAN